MGSVRPYRARRATQRIAAGVSVLLILAGCGTRVSDERVAMATKGGPAEATTVAAGETSSGASGVTGQVQSGAVTDQTATGAAAPAAGGGTAAGTTAAATGVGAASGATKNTAAPTGGAAKTTTGGAAPCTAQGPPIVLGQVVSYSGFIGANVGSAIPVIAAWVKHINATGGIACHPVQVFSADDASDPGKSSAAVQDLVKNKKAVALVANFVPLSIAGFKSALNTVKVPAVGGDLYSTTWWSDPLFYPVGSAFEASAVGSTISVASSGANKVALLYCIEAAVCPPYGDAVRKYAASSNYQIVYDTQITVTAPDYTTQCQAAKNAGATQISMIVEGASVGRIARSCAAIGYFPRFALASLGATFAPTDENIQKMSVTIASAANNWFSTDSAGQKEFRGAMQQYAPSQKLDPTSPLAWADGMMLKAAVEKLGSAAVGVPVTTAMIEKGLSMIKNETLQDMIKPTSFDPAGGLNPRTPCYYTFIFSKPGSPPGRWEDAPSGCVKGLK